MTPAHELRVALDDEIKRLLVDATYSGRGHMVASARWSWRNSVLGLPAAILAGVLASSAGISVLAGGAVWLTALLAFLSVAFQAAYGFVRPAELAQAHGSKGNRYISLRNEARFFREIDMRLEYEAENLAARLRDLRDRYNALNESDPQIPRWAYDQAKKEIAQGESDYENDPLWEKLH